MKLTLVVPCFNEEESVIEFYSEVTRVFKDKVEDYELVFVNDGRYSELYTKRQIMSRLSISRVTSARKRLFMPA